MFCCVGGVSVLFEFDPPKKRAKNPVIAPCTCDKIDGDALGRTPDCVAATAVVVVVCCVVLAC